ncbi:hypothetical protein A3860_07335 [Niastella vici]|uniref:Knr4/Smi1-like domain-containing protein n=1 Tax=Niastella vici TaxID=1703345 RepID=A0A1V9FIL1_9BACT|nr:SMI1/KNR4 family protein [Niastella vici]OQP58131.1 hypothetical protein A3860_07335 [Niastella vici]
MDWIEFISTEISKKNDIELRFNSPVPESRLIELKEQFGLTQLPFELEQFYRQTNGIDEYIYVEKIGEFIWSIDRVIETNKFNRNSPRYKDIYKSFDDLLFFSDAGNGDLFGFETLNGKFERSDVYVWNHENDSREWIAPNMKVFIEGWTNGFIKV